MNIYWLYGYIESLIESQGRHSGFETRRYIFKCLCQTRSSTNQSSFSESRESETRGSDHFQCNHKGNTKSTCHIGEIYSKTQGDDEMIYHLVLILFDKITSYSKHHLNIKFYFLKFKKFISMAI